MGRFAGMTLPVAEFLATRVLNTLDSEGSSTRATAREFGIWAKDLPDLLSPQAATPLMGHKRAVSTSSTTGFPLITSMPASHRPSSRQASGISVAIRTPGIAPRSLSRASSFGALGFTDALDFKEVSELSTVIDQESLEEEQEEQEQDQDDDEDFDLASLQTASRSTSTNKRRKRGARKGRSTTPFQSVPALPPTGVDVAPSAPKDQALLSLAFASETLARELSTASKVSMRSTTSLSTKQSSESARARRRNQPFEPVSMFPMPTSLISGNKDPASMSLRSATSSTSVPSLHSSVSSAAARSAAGTSPSATSAPQLPKKNKWFSLGKSSGAAVAPSVGRVSPVEELHSSSSSTGSAASSSSHHNNRSQPQLSATASNVTDLIMGLSPPIPPIPRHVTRGREEVASGSADDTWNRGRRMRESPGPNGSRERLPAKSPGGKQFSRSPHPAQSRERAVSPNSIQSKAASSNLSTNWRSSMVSSAGTSTSGFTKYSNGSVRSVSTANTSVSGNSWRTTGSKPSAPSVTSSSSHNRHGNNPNMPPRNVKSKQSSPLSRLLFGGS